MHRHSTIHRFFSEKSRSATKESEKADMASSPLEFSKYIINLEVHILINETFLSA